MKKYGKNICFNNTEKILVLLSKNLHCSGGGSSGS